MKQKDLKPEPKFNFTIHKLAEEPQSEYTDATKGSYIARHICHNEMMDKVKFATRDKEEKYRILLIKCDINNEAYLADTLDRS